MRTVALVALAGAAIGAVLARLRRPLEAPERLEDERTQELRRKLAEARAAAADQDDFEVAGMGAETIVEEPPRASPAEAEEAPRAEPAPEPEPEPRPSPPKAKEPPPAAESPPQDEFEAMRRRIHEEGKAAAEEMRRASDPPEKP